LTRGIDAVEDVLYGCGCEGGAEIPSAYKAIVCWCTSPGVEEVGWEGSEIGAVEPSVVKVSTA